jgi:pSer/pThr/pTyr-binding forkhead associated (FHA) protein
MGRGYVVTGEITRRFREACGLSGPLNLALRGPGGEEVLRTLDRPFAVIGRAPALDVTLDGEGVSRRHAMLQVIDGRPFLLDLQSRSGLRWSGGQVPWSWLGTDAAVSLGPWELRLGPDPAPNPRRPVPVASPPWPLGLYNPLSSRPSEHEQLPPLTLEFPDQPSPLWPMRSVLALVGRSADCRVRIDAGGISRHHSVLVRTPTGPWVIGLLGRGRLTLNGRDIRFAPLADGDEIRIGEHRIRVHLATVERLASAGRELALPRRGGPVSALRPSPAGSPRFADLEVVQAPTSLERTDPLLAQMVAQFVGMQQQMFEQFQEMVHSMGNLLGNLHREQMELVRAELDELRRVNRDLLALQARPGAVAAEGPRPAAEGHRPAGANPPPGPVSPPGSAERPPSRSTPRPGPPAAGPGDSAQPDLHIQIAHRIAGLKKEQQTRWRRIFDLVRDSSR